MIATIDTMAAVERLESAGIATAQAKALVGVFAEANKAAIDNLATKDELKAEIAKIETKIETVRTEIANSARSTVVWLIGALVAVQTIAATVSHFWK